MQKLAKDQGYVVAVSGGPDSVYLLTELMQKGFSKIVLAHVNYHYRDDSDVDQSIVEMLAKQFQLPLKILTIDPIIYQKKIGNFEAWARQTRYAFFQEVAQEFSFKNLLVAHNQNDHIETYCLQKERANLVNQFGLARTSKQGDLIIERPLLNVKKSTILRKLNKKKIPYQIDSTNENQKFARNRIRAQLQETDFPQYNQEIKTANRDLKKQIKTANEYLKKHRIAESLELDNDWKSFSTVLQSRILYLFFQKYDQKLVQNRKRQLIQEIIKRLENSPKNFWMIPIDNVYIFKDYQYVRLIDKKRLVPKKVVIKNSSELYLTEEFPNGPNLVLLIKKDGQSFPYVISNNYEVMKDEFTIKNKSVKSYYNGEKTPYLSRFQNGLVYRKGSTKVLF